ncbi:MAG: flavin reductase family protein [Candidatus Marinimicrobia bacterium]|nr:flavin reductase family protein [Candidatus Neomarinimicrobiota bacterium]
MITTNPDEFYHFYPSIAAVIGARCGDEINFMTAAWHSGVSHTPPLYMVSIAPKRHTHDMIIETGEFTCNFLPINQIKIIHGCGIVSGADIDKVDKLEIQLEKSIQLDCPVIASAYAAYECRVVHQYPAGDHTLFVGEVAAVHVDQVKISERGILDPNKIDFAMYLGTNTYISEDPESERIVPRELDKFLDLLP